MPAKQVKRVWTREEVLALPDDGNRYELVDGELVVSPTPRWLHQSAVVRLTMFVFAYVERHALGRFAQSPAELSLPSGHVLQPDLFVSGMIDGRVPREWKEAGIPLLVVEVLSPSNPDYDRKVKRSLYQKAGVPTFWVVDIDARAVEVWTPAAGAPIVETARLSWQPNAAIAPLEIDLVRFFSGLERA